MKALLKPHDYAQNESIPAAAQEYRREALRRGEGVPGFEVAYGDDLYQRIALFVPPRPEGTVLMYMHGGGWTSGFKEMLAFMAPGFMEAGVIFASAGYRLAPAHVFPAGYDDACDAFAWLQRHVAQQGGDPKRMFVGGHSSGGHYAALMAVRQDWLAARGVAPDAIRGCLAVSGVYDLTAEGGLSQRPRFLGAPDSGSEREASPILQIQGQPPPFLIAHGSDDFPHLVKQAARMHAALHAAGGAADRMVFEGRTHFQASLATVEPDTNWLARALAFMDIPSRTTNSTTRS